MELGRQMMSMGRKPQDSRRGRKLSLQLNRLAYMLLAAREEVMELRRKSIL